MAHSEAPRQDQPGMEASAAELSGETEGERRWAQGGAIKQDTEHLQGHSGKTGRSYIVSGNIYFGDVNKKD